MRHFTLSFYLLITTGLFAQGDQSDPLSLAAEQLVKLGVSADDLKDMVVRDDYRSGSSNVRHIYYRQRFQGVEVFNADLALHLNGNGQIVHLTERLVRGIGKKVNSTEPAIGADDALRSVLQKERIPFAEFTLLEYDPLIRRSTYAGADMSDRPIHVQLVLQPLDGAVRLAWDVSIALQDGSHWWNIRIDAMTGVELDRNDWVANCLFDRIEPAHVHGSLCAPESAPPPAPASPNDYNVYPMPVESPSHGSRTLHNAPWNLALNASPLGWHDTDGVSGAEFTITRGNNVHAQEDRDANNGTGYSPDGGATLDFDFPINFADEPILYEDAAITNLFYWNNIIHDVLYQYGFDEPSGNFQNFNYTATGLGADYVLADAQDGGGINNANFGTPPDGSNPRMQMYLWNTATPQLDGDLDNGIIVHEYGHGVSNRLVGGPANTSCLSNAEQMGEGWSDYLSLILTIEPGDLGTDGRGIGTYALDEPVTGGGIRPAPYSTDFGVNDYTYGNTNSGVSQPHGIGFVWCTILWEMTWDLISVHGFDPDIYNGTGGNNIALELVMEGLKLTACNPGFVDGRDAILQADINLNGGANQNLLWGAFARRGLGASADQGSSGSRSDQVEAFDLPVDDNVGVFGPVFPMPGAMFDCNNSGIVEVEVRNAGLVDQSNFPISYQLDNGTIVTQNYPGTLPAGSVAIMNFGNNLTVTGLGLHTFRAWTSLPGDLYNLDDTLEFSIDLQNSSSIPFVEDVEGGNLLPTGWSLINPDNATTWSTTGLAEGPACVPTTAWRLDHYTYSSSGQLDLLQSPAIDLTGGSVFRLLFDHAYVEYSSFYTDAFRVEISSDCGLNWSVVFDQAGPVLATAPANTGNWVPSSCSDWRSNLVDISAYSGQEVIIRFVSVNGYGNNFYLDNVLVEVAPDNDMSITTVIEPMAGSISECDNPPIGVTARVHNAGALDQTSVTAAYQLDNGSIISEVIPGTIASGDTVTHVFSTTLDLIGLGAHQLRVWTALGGDQDLGNDTVTVDLNLTPAATLPMFDDLEAETACATTSNCSQTVCPLTGDWRNMLNGTDDDIDWRVDAGGTPSANTGPSTDLVPGTANGNYLYLEASNGCTSQVAHLESTCIPLAATVQPMLRFGYHMYGADMGELHVDLFDGTAWNNDITPALAGDQGNQWDTLEVDLSPWIGSDVVLRIRGITGANFASDLAIDALEVFDAAPPVLLSPRAFLEGPYDPATGLMWDSLRVAGQVPLIEPYSALGFAQFGSGGESIDANVLLTTGNDAIVDWVRVELRDDAAPGNVVATANALIQRDGDVVGLDGVSPVPMAIVPGDHHVAVRHRNHLGCMTAAPLSLGLAATFIDLTQSATATYGTEARKMVNSVMLLWAGEVVRDSELKYTGNANDRDPILQAIGGAVPTNTVTGYLSEDITMDGVVKYTGNLNDRDPILQNIGGAVPTSVRFEQLP